MLSNREIECIKLLAQGLSGKRVANTLKLSSRTVEMYIINARKKLKSKNTVELVYLCAKEGII